MNRTTRVLLVEHVDATGASPADARARSLALRKAGCSVDTVVLDGRPADDLQYAGAGHGPGPETLVPDAAGLRALANRVRAARAPLVVWAGAAPGGGEAARALPRGTDGWWWPTGHAPRGTTAGPLATLPGFAPPCGGATAEPARATRQRLSLWDGPFVLVPAPPSERTAALVLEAFAAAAGGRDEVDLVVFDHPRPRLEALARGHGVGQRTHFVGPAPREAEAAWLATASTVLLTGDAPLSDGLLLRALGYGCAPVAVGTAAAPIADWLESVGCAWARPHDADGIAAAIEQALERADAVQRARARGRAAAAGFDLPALAARLAPAIGVSRPAADAA